MARLRVAFAGTPAFAVPCLDAVLAADVDCVAAYTQPDRPAGRGRALQPSPVKERALAAGVPVEQPETLKEEAAQQRLAAYRPDLFVVVAYGLILPRAVLAIPPLGCWNVHASLLPRWRGAAPIQRALLAGDAETGVDLMRMEAGLDTGPVYLERRTPISADDTGQSLHDRLAALGAELLAEGLRRLIDGTLPEAQPQSGEGITYAHKLDKAEALIDWSRPARAIERQVRAFQPWPVAEAEILGERIRVHSARATAGEGEPGSVLAAGRDGILVACGSGALAIERLQRAGGRVIGAQDYLNARPTLRRP